MGSLSTVYLVAYNAVLAVGWSYVLMLTAYSLAGYKQSGTRTLYTDIEMPLKFSQTMAFLEILHAALGLVRSDVVLTAFQVFSRLSLLWLVAEPGGPAVQQHYAIVPVVLAWTITEIVRYSFYGLSLCGKRPYLLKWCRYTFFIILWPVGVAGEVLLIFALMPIAKSTGMLSLRLPNSLNFGFDFYWYLWCTSLTYIPVFPQLYSHMLTQRRKIIGGEKKTD